MMSAADKEPPGCPLPAVAIILIMCWRTFFAICVSSGTDRSNGLLCMLSWETTLMRFDICLRVVNIINLTIVNKDDS